MPPDPPGPPSLAQQNGRPADMVGPSSGEAGVEGAGQGRGEPGGKGGGWARGYVMHNSGPNCFATWSVP